MPMRQILRGPGSRLRRTNQSFGNNRLHDTRQARQQNVPGKVSGQIAAPGCVIVRRPGGAFSYRFNNCVRIAMLGLIVVCLSARSGKEVGDVTFVRANV